MFPPDKSDAQASNESVAFAGAQDRKLQNALNAGFFWRKYLRIEMLFVVNDEKSLLSILQQIAGIQTMERGKLSVLKESSSGPFYKIQARENGKNVTRYVPRDQVPAVQEAIDGYQRFQNLTEQYARLKIEETRAAIAAGSKKKTRAGNSSLPGNRKSSS